MMEIIVFWLHGGNGLPLFPYRSEGGSFGVDYDSKRTMIFRNIEAVKKWWSSIHRFPEDYEHCLYNGYLKYMDRRSGQLLMVMK